MADTNHADGSFMEKYLTPIAVVVGALIIAGAFAFGQGGGDRVANEPEPQPVDIADVKTDTGPFVGRADAPVTMAVWFDYKCPHCVNFERTTLTELTETYVARGDLKIVYKDFQFLSPASTEAAIYSRAVWEASPELWGTWIAGVFAEDAAAGDKAAMDRIATAAGIDAARVGQLLSEKRATYEAAVAADRNEGQSFGINSTPSTIIGTQMLSGAQPVAAVSALIDAQLAN